MFPSRIGGAGPLPSGGGGLQGDEAPDDGSGPAEGGQAEPGRRAGVGVQDDHLGHQDLLPQPAAAHHDFQRAHAVHRGRK